MGCCPLFAFTGLHSELGSETNTAIANVAAAQLLGFGSEAFPYLLESLYDDKPFVPLRCVVSLIVGDACFCLIAYQPYALPGDYPGFYCRTGVDG